ncbi:MAG: tetratricopeptide repeat protein [Verrucomicrobiota bacterium]
MRTLLIIALIGGFWLTPDQRGQQLMEQKKYAEAAENFRDPIHVGVAWYRAGEFKKAEAAFMQIDTPEAIFNRGNCLVFQGQYETAVKQYDRALAIRPGWNAAATNRLIAISRAEALKQKGGEMGDQRVGADEIKFDLSKKSGGQDTQVEKQQPLSQEEMQALWLRRVQTKPADFLRAKFAYQHAIKTGE